MEKKVMILFLGLLCFSIGLTGCKDTGKEKAVAEATEAEATEAKAELTKVKSLLEKTKIERDELKAKVTKISESLKAAQTKIGGLLQSSNQGADVKDKLAELTKQRDAATAKTTETKSMVEKLKSQLSEQIQKITGLEGQNKKLQEIIAELKKKLGSDVEVPSIPGVSL